MSLTHADSSCLISSLWELAASRLRDKDKAFIDFGSPIKLYDLLSTVQDKQKECIEKQWGIPGGTGNTIKIRDIFTKITKWIKKFACLVGFISVLPTLPFTTFATAFRVLLSFVTALAVYLPRCT